MAGPTGDTPIIIRDGSLTLESAVPWAQYTDGKPGKHHPHSHKAVPQVVVTLAGKDHPLSFSAQQCQVIAQYASTKVTVATAGDGTGLHVDTDWSQFQPGANGQLMEHIDKHQSISHVTVMKGSQTEFDSAAAGGARIAVSYK